MSATLALAGRLATARLADARGAGALDAFAVAAYAVAAWLSFVVASGTWMFVRRREDVPAWLLENGASEAPVYTTMYVVLAAMACALLVLPILALGGAAARLGARGRARRLASLRLIGMTGGEVVGMSVVEGLVQAAAGIVWGLLAWGASVPLLSLLSFQHAPIGAHELLMPWWCWLGVIAVILALAAASTVLGLTQVRISPLGVTRQQPSPALRAWRVLALALGVLAVIGLSALMQLPLGGLAMGLTFAGMLAFTLTMINLFAPWLLQLIARMGVRTGSPARLLAMRRIVADPRGAWRNVSSLSLLGVLVGMLAAIPLDNPAFADLDVLSAMLIGDIRNGALLTLAIALVVGAASTALAQGSDVVDRSDELVALDKMGVPPGLDAAVRRHQVVLPLVFSLGVSLTLGVFAGLPIAMQLPGGFGIGSTGTAILALSVGAALAMTLLAAESTRPLRRRVLTAQVRRND